MLNHVINQTKKFKRATSPVLWLITFFLTILSSVEQVQAVANISLTPTFVSADSPTRVGYMDSGGVWNGAAEVTSTTGDRFNLRVVNSGAASPADDAIDVRDIRISMTADFMLSSGTVNVTPSGGCPAISSSANQPGGAGNDIILNIPNNTDIEAGCTYDFEFGLSTSNSAPFVTAGNHTLTYDFTYESPVGNNNTVSQNQTVAVRTGSLAITKALTVATPSATSGDTISYDVTVTSNGSGGLFDVVLTDTVSADLTNVTITPVSAMPPGSAAGPGGNQYTISYMDPGQSLDFTVTADVVVTTSGTCPILNNTASVTDRTTAPTQVSAPVVSVPYEYDAAALAGTLRHDITANVFTSNSYCELCGEGVVRIVLENPLEVDMTNIEVRENLNASSGLVYVTGSTRYYVDGAGPNVGGDPTGTVNLTWDSTDIPNLANLPGSVNPAPNRQIIIEFRVERSIDPEGLVTVLPVDRTIQADATFDLACSTASHDAPPAIDVLPLREPIPSVTKTGRNVDAGQTSYTNPVYGNEEDDVVWRIDIANGGLAAMQDVILDDLMTAGNFTISYACPTEGEALDIANNIGVSPDCIASSNTIADFEARDPFGNPPSDEPVTYTDVPAQGNAQIYLVGKVTSSCNNQTNTVDNIRWGCRIGANNDGGISATSTGATAGSSTATMSTLVNNAQLNVQREIVGVNGNPTLGSRGTVRLTITNNTGGTVQNIKLTDVLPVEYVVDPTFTPTLTITHPAGYGNYDGMIDVITWDNPAANTFPVFSSTDPLEPLANKAPVLRLRSYDPLVAPTASDSYTINGTDEFHLLRHGDQVVVEFQIVMINTNYIDRIADLDTAPETTTSNHDPLDNPFTVTNDLQVEFNDLCNPGTTHTDNYNGESFTADPEDLDIDIVGTGTFILTNDPNQRLPLIVEVTNNGGHNATNYFVYVSFGTTMEVVSWPVGTCSLTTNPPLLEVWDVVAGAPATPADIPATAAVYQCLSPPNAAIGRNGGVATYNFEVVKTTDAARITADDLTFRADVIGEVTLNDGTPLWFPEVQTTTTTPAAQIDNRANNYSLDAIRARILGFNLTKTRVGECSENNPPTVGLEANVEIAEECTVRIRTGGWFGFETPGFTLIQVQNVQVVDELPDGQGYISSTDPYLTSDLPAGLITGIAGISLNPPGLTPLDEGWFDWTFNQVDAIKDLDKWFQADATTRILNDPVDSSAAPNVHAAISSNELNSTFDAVFETGGVQTTYNLGPSTVGYPDPPIRTVNLTVTEPNLLVTKEVCNEDLYTQGTGCTNFVDTADDGDTNDSYIYRIRIENEASAGSVVRAPAYNVISTDTLDNSDLMLVVPFNTDGLDNDGDGLIDGADGDGEGSISDNIVNNATPAVITFSTTHSTRLQKINPGEVFYLYYRVDPDDAIAPLQTLTNTVTMTYDSQTGDTGNQTVDLRTNGDPDGGSGRVYNTIPAQANVQIINLIVPPASKGVMRLSNTSLGGAAPYVGPQNVSVGEEVEYQLQVQIPVSNLRNFVIRDELPAGISCIEAPVVDLNSANSNGINYAAAGFVPGGQITPTCTNNLVEWNFGNQELTLGGGTRFDFKVKFIGRIDNVAANVEALSIRNGGTGAGSTNVTATYVNEASATITLNLGPADVTVREPQIALTKAFAVPNSDASDVLTVTVTATNTGTAAAYNLRVLDDLAAVANLTYLGNVGGVDPPDNVTFLAGNTNRPIFSWNSSNPDNEILTTAPDNVRSFTFDVRVDLGAQPHEILDNTIEASWTSLPGQTTALNSTNLIGADGSASGMRIGAIPNAGDPLNDYETTASASTTVLPLTMNKTDLDNTIVPTIGAHKNFQIEINLPEGTSNNVVAVDNLIASGLSYFLSNNALFDITYTFEGIATINGQAPSEAAFNAFPADNTSNTATWDIGTVVTTSEDDSTVNAINPVIRINYYARVNNDLVTDAGDSLQNGVDVTYSNGETAAVETLTDNTVAVTVLEPLLTATKTVTNTAVGNPPPVGGSILEYVITVTNSNTNASTAFDVNLVDTIAAETQFYPAFTPTALINGSAVAGFVATPTGANAGPLIWGSANADGTLDIPAGQSLVLTYRVQVQPVLTPGTTLENSVMIDWTSLDDVSTYERTGAGCPTITLPNDYCIGPIVASAASTPPSLVIQKTVVNQTTGQDPGKNASPGDVLTYTITVRNTAALDTPVFTVTDEVDRLTTLPVLFEAGTLTNVTAVGGLTAPTIVNNPTGGTNGTGLLEVQNLSLQATGGSDTVTITFDVTLAPVITSGRVVLNQAQVNVPNITPYDSDDPTVNGVDNPLILGDEDPTETTISSAPLMRVQKTSQDMTGDPAVLEAGDTLRYTITVENYGNEDAVNSILNDAIPVNTSYAANTTTLNGVAVADPSAGVSAIEAGMLVNSPATTTAGLMLADANGALTINNIATITFDVVISPTAINGTIISNQGYVNADGAGNSGAIPQQPSDDPGTPTVPDDPTIDVVGNVPLIDVQKTVAIQVDNGTIGILDPLDIIRYTITIRNLGALEATEVMLTDNIPANTTYVANSVMLNGVNIPDVAGVSPLVAGSYVRSSDLPALPLPITDPADAIITSLQSAVVIFDVQVNAGTSTGTIIRNQGLVTSNELPAEPTDWDGDDSNGDQPTDVVVGNAQALSIIKSVSVVGGGPALAGGQLEYQVRVTNIGAVPASDVVITDSLNLADMSLVGGSALLNGSATGVSYAAPVLTADYSTTYGDLAPGNTATLRFRVLLNAGLAIGYTVTNTATVYWNAGGDNASDSVSIDIGGTPGVATLNGTAWHDANFDNVLDAGERLLDGWFVDVYRNAILLGSVQTDSNGVYQIVGLSPYTSGTGYELKFRQPGAGPATNTALLGLAHSSFTNNLQQILDIYASSGSNLQNLNLPIDPNGEVYNSLLRTPVAGATLTMLRASTGVALPANCFDDVNQQNQVTLALGYYKFDINFSQPECPSGNDYTIQVVEPGSGYNASPSVLIPPQAGTYDVPTCAADAIPATANACEMQASEFAPTGAAATTYYLTLTLDSSVPVPSGSQLFNNHIPLDPSVGSAIAITKTSALLNVTRAQLVPYTITVRNTFPSPLNLNIVDNFPAGFKYVKGSAQIDGIKTEPVINAQEMRWNNFSLGLDQKRVIKMLLVVSSGVSEGEYVNSVFAENNLTIGDRSGTATATVRVVPDPTFDCSDVIGKVFDDKNLNGYQDEGEEGLPGVRVATARGLLTKTDKHGRFHITCAVVPDQNRGSNFIMKLDPRTLPTGYRVTTENPRVQRATRGKMLKYNFGATVHRVVKLDLAEGVFKKDSAEMRLQWTSRVDLLLEELKKQTSILRLSYLADIEDEDLVDDRIEAVKEMIEQRWQEMNCCYSLMIETEVFWRRGGPVDQGDFE